MNCSKSDENSLCATGHVSTALIDIAQATWLIGSMVLVIAKSPYDVVLAARGRKGSKSKQQVNGLSGQIRH